MDITLGERDDQTGRFNFARDPLTGDVQFDDTEAHAVVTSAAEDLGTYWADSTHGSELSTLGAITSSTATTAEAMVLASEQPLEQQNKILNVSADASTGVNNGLGLLGIDLTWNVPGSAQQQNAGV